MVTDLNFMTNMTKKRQQNMPGAVMVVLQTLKFLIEFLKPLKKITIQNSIPVYITYSVCKCTYSHIYLSMTYYKFSTPIFTTKGHKTILICLLQYIYIYLYLKAVTGW